MIDWTQIKAGSLADLKNQLPDGYLEIEEGDRPIMADTVGSLIDKVTVVNLKMWHNQEILYEIRRMDEEEFVEKYGNDLKQVHRTIKICCDMNVLRNQLIDEINSRLAKLVETLGGTHEDIESLRLLAPSHKSY